MQNTDQEPPLNVTFHPAASVMQNSNVVFVNNSSEEFIMDYGIGAPGRDGVEIFSRIALSPRNAKMMLKALQERITQYEQAFGEIKLPEQVDKPQEG